MQAGEIYRIENFYVDTASGQALPKYLMVLALPVGGDIVARLLTSRHAPERPEAPPCHHGDPYAGFYLGIPGDPLTSKTWLDLRAFDDIEVNRFQQQLQQGGATRVATVSAATLRAALECAAAANDTTRQQTRHILDQLAELG